MSKHSKHQDDYRGAWEIAVHGFLGGIQNDRLDWRYTRPSTDAETEILRQNVVPYPQAVVEPEEYTQSDLMELLEGFASHVKTLHEFEGRLLAIHVLLSACYVAARLGIPCEKGYGVHSILRRLPEFEKDSEAALRNKRVSMPRYVLIMELLRPAFGYRAYELPLRSKYSTLCLFTANLSVENFLTYANTFFEKQFKCLRQLVYFGLPLSPSTLPEVVTVHNSMLLYIPDLVFDVFARRIRFVTTSCRCKSR